MVDYLSVVCNHWQARTGQGSSALPMLQAVGVASLFTISSEQIQQQHAKKYQISTVVFTFSPV
jgi:hypothetical protein